MHVERVQEDADRDTSWQDCRRDCREHCCKRPTLTQVVVIGVFLFLFFGVIVLTSTGHLQQAADTLKTDVGTWPKHAIFLGLLAYTGLFFGYGWSFVVIAAGYTLGWWAILTVNIGQLIGGILGFVSSRYLLRGTIERKLRSLPGSWERRLTFFQSEISRSFSNYLFVSGALRNAGAFTFGMCNAFDAAMTKISLPACLLCISLTSQHSIVAYVYIGTLVDSLSNPGSGSSAGGAASGTAAGPSDAESAARRTMLIIQICIAVCLLVSISCWARWRIKKLERAHRATEPA